MSYQTKIQSLGYIILGYLRTELPAKNINEIIELGPEVIPNQNNIT